MSYANSLKELMVIDVNDINKWRNNHPFFFFYNKYKIKKNKIYIKIFKI